MRVSELWTSKSEVQCLNSLSPKKSEVAYIVQSLKFKDQSSKSEGRGLSEVYPKFKIRTLSLKFKVWSSNSDVWSSKSVRSLKEWFNCKTRMPGTVKCRPTVAYWVQIDGINIATELITRYYLNGTLIQCCFNARPTSATLARHWTNIE